MEILYKVLILLACALIGYGFGSISSGIIISNIKYRKDPRDYGSHNSGGTNVGRTFGLKFGLLTIFFDMLKTILPLLGVYFGLKYISPFTADLKDYGYMLCAIFSCVGHCWPIWHNFKGGKAVSCLGGIVLATSWFLGVIGVPMFLVIVLLSKKVSLGSICTSLGVSIVSFFFMFMPSWFVNFGMNTTSYSSLFYSLSLLVCSLILIYRHRGNIKRLIKGEENELHFGKNKKKDA